MLVRFGLGLIICIHAAFVVFQLIMALGDIRRTSEAYMAPGDPFWLYWGVITVNGLIAVAAVCLGIYFMRARRLRLIYVLPLSVAIAFFGGGHALAISAATIGLCIFENYRLSGVSLSP